MTKSETFPLKQNVTCANYGVYVATCNAERYAVTIMLVKQ